MNFITPIILIIISFAVFFGYVDPAYRVDKPLENKMSIKSLLAEDAEYQSALNNTTEIRKKRDSLVEKRGAINPNDLTRLEKLLPDNIDNIRLVIDIKQIAENYTLTLKNIKLDAAVKEDPSRLGQDNNKYGTVGLTFSVSSSYDNFQNFLADLEKSLRLVDITELSVTGNDTGIYDFTVSLKTYWLK
jgi:Tfp pilus assembly protein PilO